jgi:hypothetical protein
MNERIKELMKEANKDITLGKPFWPALEEFSEKFAELIVRECVDICNQAILQNQDTLSKLNEDELAEKMAIHGAILQAQKLGNGINEQFGLDCYTQEDLDQAHERGIELANKLRVE